MVAVMTVVKQDDGRCRDLFVESVRDASQDGPYDHVVQVAYWDDRFSEVCHKVLVYYDGYNFGRLVAVVVDWDVDEVRHLTFYRCPFVVHVVVVAFPMKFETYYRAELSLLIHLHVVDPHANWGECRWLTCRMNVEEEDDLTLNETSVVLLTVNTVVIHGERSCLLVMAHLLGSGSQYAFRCSLLVPM